MLKEKRRIWSEDQYQFLGSATDEDIFYFGREKGKVYQIFERSPNKGGRRLVQTLSFEEPSTVLASEGRTEHILMGYAYHGRSKVGLEDLSSDVEIQESVLSTGAQAIWLIPKGAREWTLSLHGGPESSEGCEIRYGGLYRSFFKQKKAIAILNYRGSSNLASEISRQAWGDWQSAIQEDFESLCKEAIRNKLNPVPQNIFGVSFGGALALLLQKNNPVDQVILSSPLLDLPNQIARTPEEERAWFHARFSKKDRLDFSYESLCAERAGKVRLLYSLQDEVLGPEMFQRLEADRRNHPAWLLVPRSGGHAPKSYLEISKLWQVSS